SIDLGTLVIKEQEEDSSQSTTENESLSKKPAFMRQPARTMTKPIKIENPEEFNIIMAANYEARLKKIRANKITQFETSRLHSLPHLAILINAVIAATEFVHHATLLHLDIKPDNIVYDPETGLAKLTDFGGSLISDKAGIDADPTRGSPMFLEPEQEAA